MRLAAAFIIALLVSPLTGCSRHYSAQELAGKYALSVGEGTDTIVLNANGTYTETYRATSGQEDHQEGTWTLEEVQAGPTVVLSNFRPPFAKDPRPGFYFLLVEKKWFGNIYLITNIDLNEGYKRQP